MLTRYGTDNVIIMVAAAIVFIVAAFLINRTWAFCTLFPAGILLLLFTIEFFRDPERKIPDKYLADESLIIAPCDGKVIEIKEVEEKEFFHKKVRRISIFLSIFNEHVNRIPISGEITYFRYNPGDYLVAYHPKSSELNEQTHIGIENRYGKLYFKQIVGIMARRLVWEIKQGDRVERGKRFGMMKFGSRIDILLDDKSEIFVKPGDKTVAGESVIGRVRS